MFNQYPESTDFAKIILPCMSDKRVYKSVTANTSTNLAIIKIPTRQFKNNPTLLFGAESNISGTIVFEKGAAGNANPFYTFLDCNAYSLFKRVRVLHGSTVISDINSYAQYMQCENDMTLSPADEYLQSNNLAGGEPAGGALLGGANLLPIVTTTTTTSIPSFNTPTASTPAVGVITNTGVFQSSAINILQLGFSPTFLNNISSVPFSFNLKNFLGGGLEGLLPLHLITNNDLILEIELETCDNCMLACDANNTVASMSIVDLQYNAILTHIPMSVSNLLYPNNTATIVGVDKYSDIKQAEVGVPNMNIQYDNFKFKYAKAIIFFFQNTLSRNNQTRAYISQRTKGGAYSYSLMYNNKTYPNTKIENVSEQFNQTLKCFNSNKSTLPFTHYSNNLAATSQDDYIQISGTEIVAPVYQFFKKFVGGIPLQRYYTDDKHFTGIDISVSSLSLNIELATVSYNASGNKTITPAVLLTNNTYVLQSYCIFDVVYNIKDGEITMIK